eukprot:TRINITY_DN1923_c0_g1_i2.p1 TRINITY_DN1923_c0_g1~~TRINITY_DN1923_c0_g1_i2.p1  ORF type:complete len:239 (-),score=27.70 TRINITY_DN1923_c0_g1_i2:3-719(-)
MQRGLVGSEMCIRDRYQRRVHGPIKMLLQYMQVVYRLIELDLEDEKDRLWYKTHCESLGLEFPTLQSLQDPSRGLSLGYSIAIIRYLTQRFKQKMASSNMNELTEQDTLLKIFQDLRQQIISGFERGWESAKEEVLANTKEKLYQINKFMRNRTYLSGKYIMIADFAFVKLMNFLNFLSEGIVSEFPQYIKIENKLFRTPEIIKYVGIQHAFNMDQYIPLYSHLEKKVNSLPQTLSEL